MPYNPFTGKREPWQYSFEERQITLSAAEYERRVGEWAQDSGIAFFEQPEEPTYDYYCGLDLGWTHDHTALSIGTLKLEPIGKEFKIAKEQTNFFSGDLPVKVFYDVQRVRGIHHIHDLDRVTGRKPSLLADDIVEKLMTLGTRERAVEEDQQIKILLVVDATQDWSFIELLRKAAAGRGNPPKTPLIEVREASIRPNHEEVRQSPDTGRWLIPRNDLLLQGGRHPLEGEEVVYVDKKPVRVPKRKRARIRWHSKLPYRDVLEKELLSFVPVVNLNTDYTRFEPRRREGHEHDDLVFALCLGVFFAERGVSDAIRVDRPAPMEILPPDPADEYPPPEPAGRSPLTGVPLPPLPK
jgi:hypothetical protein